MPADHVRLRRDAGRLAELTAPEREALERDVRRAASRVRLLLQPDPHVPGGDRYRLVDARAGRPASGEGYGLMLAQAVDRLTGGA